MIIILYFFSIFSMIGTWLPMIDDAHWIIRGQSFFRSVYLGLNLLLITLFFFFTPLSTVDLLLLAGLLLSVILCLTSILPFTRISSVEVPLLQENDSPRSLNVMIYNVYQFNDRYQDCIDLVKEADPDILFLVETNTDWAKGLKELKDWFPYHFEEIRENTYGLMFFSKLEIKEGGINYLVEPNIPSAEVLIYIEDVPIRILGLHPKPPIPGEALSTKLKDRELAQAARYFAAQKEDDHQILIGDLNDVAWSRASINFKKATGMRDPRVGRGFYSTFPTWFPIRIPLDHVFCSPDLKLLTFKTMRDIGSDHYPVNVVFHIPKKVENAKKANLTERKEASA